MAPIAIGVGMAVLGATTGIVGNIIKGKAEEEQANKVAEAHEFNASQKERTADLIRKQATEDERRLRVQARREFGGIRAAYGASGVTLEGSPVDVLEDSVATAELDALTIREQGERKYTTLREEASFERQTAAYTREAGKFSVGKALFGAGQAVANAYPTLSRATG